MAEPGMQHMTLAWRALKFQRLILILVLYANNKVQNNCVITEKTLYRRARYKFVCKRQT